MWIATGDGLIPLLDAKDQQHNFITMSEADYNEYLQYQAVKQQSSSSGTS